MWFLMNLFVSFYFVQPVGCDMMLGSPIREDKCRECGGDNSGCNTASGVIEDENLQVGMLKNLYKL